jgi:alkyldihydroxyacetonephosphate synthase
VLVPFGGGTNAAQDLLLNHLEKRMIVSVDMTRMNKVLWVDKENMLTCVQAGMFGIDMDKYHEKFGVTVGHEPDSNEFSTVGGWVSTRASGMKKNVYGNIEDIVQNVKLVTSIGTMTKLGNHARISGGPDLTHIILGSEGNLGIVTEAVFRLRPMP